MSIVVFIFNYFFMFIKSIIVLIIFLLIEFVFMLIKYVFVFIVFYVYV